MAALATAILRGSTSPEHLDELLSRGAGIADLSYSDPLGRQLIHLAADTGDLTALRWVLSHGVDPRASTALERNTALHIAAAEGNGDIVTCLLEEASVGVAGVNRAGETALDVALAAGHDSIVAELTRHLRPLPLPTQQQQQQQQQQQPQPQAESIVAGTASYDRDPKRYPVSEEDIGGDEKQGAGAGVEEPQPPETITASAPGAAAAAARSGGTKDKARAMPSLDSGKAKGRTPPFDGRGVTQGGFFVAGAWSKAGVCSCFNVRHRHLLGKHGIVFDMGVCPSEVVHVQHVFITHGHLDHCGAVVSHARLRALSQGKPAKYYMHAELATGIDKVRRAFEEVEGDKISMDIVTVGPEDTVDLGQGCFVRPFLVKHRVEALGFALMRRKAEGLKQEYRNMDGKALGALKKRGVDVSICHESVEVVYTGDTVMSGLEPVPLVWKARLLIMEVTYLEGDRTAAAKNHHIHVQDVLDNVDNLEGVEQVLVAHVSERHGGHRNVLRLLAAALPPPLLNKVSVALGEFGAPHHLTFLEDYILEEACTVQAVEVES